MTRDERRKDFDQLHGVPAEPTPPMTPDERAEKVVLSWYHRSDTTGPVQVAEIATAIRDAETAAVAKERTRVLSLVELYRPADSTDSRHQGAAEACNRIEAAIREEREP